jgi:hypothetical protein
MVVGVCSCAPAARAAVRSNAVTHENYAGGLIDMPKMR